MRLTKLHIENYRSIKDITLDSVNYNNDSTTIFVGINEAGKSNVLKAITLLDVDSKNFKWAEDCNIESKKTNSDISILGTFDFSNEKTELKEFLQATSDKYNVKSIVADYSFLESIVKTVTINKDNKKEVLYTIGKSIKFADTFLPESKDKEQAKITGEIITFLFSKIKVIFWEPDEKKYLISDPINLDTFSANLDNIPLKNMFGLLGKTTQTDIKHLIDSAKTDIADRETLEEDLATKTTEYIKNVWKEQNTYIKVRIEQQNATFMCSIFVVDKGENNKHKNFYMRQRSDGYKKFVSLILSLSCENKAGKLHDKIIIIDEPEIHLHPSGCKDLLTELIKLGETNNVFISTHSVFMIDKDHPERHWIIEKNPKSERIPKNLTYCNQIGKEKSIFDDEVTCKAFGMSIINNMLPENQYLVEGLSDKILFEFLIKKINPTFSFLVRPCGGSNIPVHARLLKQESIKAKVIVDADVDGQGYKTEILKTTDNWYEDEIFTLKDLNNTIKDNSTIEDLLPIGFVQTFMSEYDKINEQKDVMVLDAKKPVIQQFKDKYNKKIKEINAAHGGSYSAIAEFKMDLAKKFIEGNKEKTIEELKELISDLVFIANDITT
ncbi:MAG: AAA family ATPase [Rickettsiales bacterium]|jgi:predicted ATP-dependent endonuclease of OLD family|nr:AAA family ATPase [Rickettsiales bacterium]